MSQIVLSVDTDSGQTVYGVIRQEETSSLVWNGTALESYADAHWSTYKLTSTEQGTSGHYVLTSPAGLASGDYVIAWYHQLGGSPSTSDEKVGIHNFEIPESSTTPTVPTDLVASLRVLANDTATSNAIYKETLSGKTDGINLYFYLQYPNVVTSSVYLTNTDGSYFRSQSGFNVDTTNGIITLSVAPSSGAEILADYNFQWFTDDDMAEFLNEAARHLSQTDSASVPDGLRAALMQYGLGYFYQRRATRYAHIYSSSAMGVSAAADKITDNFKKLADLAFQKGDDFRQAYYQRQGQQDVQASAIVTYAIDPITPMR